MGCLARAAWPAPLVGLLLLPASLAWAEAPEPDYARVGFYVAVGGSWVRPFGWQDDVEDEMGGLSNANARDNARAMFGDRLDSVDPVSIRLGGSDLAPGTGGVGALLGYRLGPHGALELEGEWIADLDSDLRIRNTGEPAFIEVGDVWNLSINLKLFALTGRIQPFGVAGVGVHGSKVSAQGQATGIITTAHLRAPPDMQPVSADFTYRQSNELLDGAIRVGVGLDAYATEHVAAQVKADYVVPFVKNGPVHTDHLSLRVGLLYRF